MPDAIWAVSRLPPDLSRSPGHAPVSTPLRFVTTPQQRFAHARLPDPHLTRSSLRLFPQRSPRTALNRRSLRWFGTSPCRATPEDLPPSPAQHRIQWLLHTRLLQRSWPHDLAKLLQKSCEYLVLSANFPCRNGHGTADTTDGHGECPYETSDLQRRHGTCRMRASSTARRSSGSEVTT